MSSIDIILKRLREGKNYSEMDHDDLISMSQKGDQRAFEELVRQYDNLITKQSRKFFLDNGNGDFEDIKQIATIAFWNAVDSYDPSIHKHGFGAFANLIISRKLTDLLRKEDADIRKLNNLAGSLDDTMTDDEGGSSTVGDRVASKDLSPEEQFLGKEGAEELEKFMKSNFSKKERDVVLRRLRGQSASEIAEETGMKYKSVDNTLRRIKDKVAEYMKSSQRESRKFRRNADVKFSDEEKQVLESIILKINQKESIRESKVRKLRESYENYTEEQLENALYDIEEELEDIVNELKDTSYNNRDDLLDRLESIKMKLVAMEEYIPEDLQSNYDELYKQANSADETEYEGPEVHTDPYEERGLRRSDFY